MSHHLTPIDPEAVAAARDALPSDDLLTLVVEACSALADPTRARILYALGTGTLCVRDLAIVTGVSESAVSHQLRLLRDRRVVKPRRAGTTIYYAVDDQHVAALIRDVTERRAQEQELRKRLPEIDYVEVVP